MRAALCKAAALALAALMLAGCAAADVTSSQPSPPSQPSQPSPPRTVRFTAPWQLITAAEAEAMTDEEVYDYTEGTLAAYGGLVGINGRDELMEMTLHMDPLPLPIVQGFELTGITYYPGNASLMITYSTGCDDMWIRTDLDPEPDTGAERELEKDGAELIWKGEGGARAYALPYEEPQATPLPGSKESWTFTLLNGRYSYFMRMFEDDGELARDIVRNGISFIDMADASDPSLWAEPPRPRETPANTPGPPETVRFTGPGQLVAPAEVEAMTDEEIQNYIGTTLAPNGFPGVSGREDIMEMAQYMESLSLPLLQGLWLREIVYWPDSGQVDISWQRGQKDEDFVRVDFSMGANTISAEEYKRNIRPQDVVVMAPGHPDSGADVSIYLLDTWEEYGYNDFLVVTGEGYLTARTSAMPDAAMELMERDLRFMDMPALMEGEGLLWGQWEQ